MPDSVPSSAQSETETLKQRQEYLVSIAVIATGSASAVKETVQGALHILESRVVFFEIVLLVSTTDYDRNRATFDALFKLRNVRGLILREGTGEYRTAVIAATEAIGDFVLVVVSDEYPFLDLPKIYDAAVGAGKSVRLRDTRRAGAIARGAGRLLSLISGYDVDPRLLRSAAFPRSHIGRVAARTDREIALRFTPRGGALPTETTILEVDPDQGRQHRLPVFRKIGMAIEVLANSPPSIFRYLAIASFTVSTCAVAYFLYALGLFIFGVPLQPGWLTTSVAISGSTAFAGLLFGAISTALYQILNLLRNATGDEVVREMNNTDFFKDFRRVNVETLVSD